MVIACLDASALIYLLDGDARWAEAALPRLEAFFLRPDVQGVQLVLSSEVLIQLVSCDLDLPQAAAQQSWTD